MLVVNSHPLVTSSNGKNAKQLGFIFQMSADIWFVQNMIYILFCYKNGYYYDLIVINGYN